MAASNVPPYPQLNIEKEPVTEWIAGFRVLMRAAQIIDTTHQRALLCHYLGPTARKEMEKTPDTGTDHDVEALIDAVITRFQPTPNTTLQRHLFHAATHRAEETIAHYHDRLHHLARECFFPETDADICSHIISSTRNDPLRRRALRQQISLPELLQLAETLENADPCPDAIAQGPPPADFNRCSATQGISNLPTTRGDIHTCSQQPNTCRYPTVATSSVPLHPAAESITFPTGPATTVVKPTSITPNTAQLTEPHA
jgi:hypothetical protein